MTEDEFRNGEGFTDDALARAVGVERSYITHIRHRRKRPSLKVALALARETGLPIEVFSVEGRAA